MRVGDPTCQHLELRASRRRDGSRFECCDCKLPIVATSIHPVWDQMEQWAGLFDAKQLRRMKKRKCK